MTYLNICDIQELKYDRVLQHSIQIYVYINHKNSSKDRTLTRGVNSLIDISNED